MLRAGSFAAVRRTAHGAGRRGSSNRGSRLESPIRIRRARRILTMAIRVALHHKTEYHYDRPVTLLPQVIRLRPAPHCRTPILSYSLKVLPGKQYFNWQQDPYSNYLARIVFLEAARDFVVEVDLVAEMIA